MSYAERGAYTPGRDADGVPYDDADEEARGRGPLLLGVAAAVVVAFSAVIWSAYHQGVREGGRDAPPLILADEQPFRERPANPGGEPTPHLDIEVFERLEGAGADATARAQAPAIELSPEEDAAPAEGEASEETVEFAGEVDLAEVSLETEPADPDPPAAETQAEADDPPEEAAPEAEDATVEFAGAFEPDAPQIRLRPAPPGEAAAEAVAETVAEAASEPQDSVVREVPPVANAEGPLYYVQLASHRSREAAENDWFQIQSESADLLGERQPLIIEVDLGDRGGVWYRIRLDGFEDRTDANAFCDLLRGRGQNCLTVRS